MNAFKRVLIYTIPVASFSVLLNIPKFFETQVLFLDVIENYDNKKNIWKLLLLELYQKSFQNLGQLQQWDWDGLRCIRAPFDTKLHLVVHIEFFVSSNFDAYGYTNTYTPVFQLPDIQVRC